MRSSTSRNPRAAHVGVGALLVTLLLLSPLVAAQERNPEASLSVTKERSLTGLQFKTVGVGAKEVPVTITVQNTGDFRATYSIGTVACVDPSSIPWEWQLSGSGVRSLDIDCSNFQWNPSQGQISGDTFISGDFVLNPGETREKTLTFITENAEAGQTAKFGIAVRSGNEVVASSNVRQINVETGQANLGIKIGSAVFSLLGAFLIAAPFL